MKFKVIVMVCLAWLICSSAGGQVVFHETFDEGLNPANSDTVPMDLWYCSGESGSVGVIMTKHDAGSLLSTMPEGADGSGDPDGYALRTGYAYNAVSIRRVLSDVTWDASKDYTISLDIGGIDHGNFSNESFGVNFRGYDGSSFSVVRQEAVVAELGAWNNYTFYVTGEDIATAGADGMNVSIWLYHNTGDFVWVDNVVVADSILPQIVSPVNGEKNVSVSPSFAWTFDESVAGYTPDKFVLTYWDEDPNFATTVDPVTSPYTPSSELAYGKTYGWRIDTYDAGTVHEGPVWSFSTVPPKPVILEQTEVVAVFEGDDAIFTVEVRNPYTNDQSGLSYQWYRAIEGASDQAVGDGADTYVVSGAVLTDEGDYYCVVTLDSNGQVATSEAATLGIKRLEAKWTMNASDYTESAHQDISGSGNAATTNDVPTFVNGADAVVEGASVIDPNSWANGGTMNPAENTNEMTVSFWCKWNGASDGDPIICKRDGWGLENAMWTMNVAGGSIRLAATQLGGDWNSGIDVPVGEWAHFAVTWDGTSARIYRNGQYAAVKPLWVPDHNTEAPIYIGTFDVTDGRLFNGSLDDIRIYSYARSPEEVAMDYYDISETAVCVNRPEMDISGPDGQPDCVVDLNDMLPIIEQWLECNLVPDCS